MFVLVGLQTEGLLDLIHVALGEITLFDHRSGSPASGVLGLASQGLID